jgi:hypothetical protein
MSEQAKELQFEGIVHSSAYVDGAKGKQFLGAIIECSDGREWVIDYEEQSPFHAFADRQVVVSGEPYEPTGQHLIGTPGGGKRGHFRVSNMRLVEVTSDAELVEVGAAQDLSGRFERSTSDAGESMLSFVTEKSTTFLVANDPAGVRAAECQGLRLPGPTVALDPKVSRAISLDHLSIFGSGSFGLARALTLVLNCRQ